MAPLYEYGRFGDGASLAVAVLLGIAFGWFLERGGMGSARKLAGQFYLTDLSVLKLMFSAILTAMLGLFWLSWAGLLDSRASTSPRRSSRRRSWAGSCSASGSPPADSARAPRASRPPPAAATAWRSLAGC
jgi:hypothetical protein